MRMARAEPGNVRVRDLLRENGFWPNADLEALFMLASAIHLVRQRTDREVLSRTSTFFAALLRDTELLNLLVESSFDFAKFRQEIDPEGRVESIAGDHGLEIESIAVNRDLFARAVENYVERFPGRPIDSRGLVYGFLGGSVRGGLLEGRLIRVGLKLGVARDLLARLLDQAAEGASAPLPRFDSDDLRDRDLLGIGPSVRAFASLFASQDLVPPLSVGLFGDWGSGKSFFMRKLRQRVDGLSETARKRRREGRATVLLGDIVQVEFNAWHYAEVNLWASLVTHIFDTLNRHFSPQEELKDRWEALIRRLDEANSLQADSQGMLRQAEEDLAATRERLRESRLGLGQAVSSLWQSFDAGTKRDLESVAGQLGLAGAEELADELVRHRAEVHQIAERMAIFRQAAVRGLGSVDVIKRYAVVVLAVGLVFGVVLLAANGADSLAATIQSLVKAAASTALVLGGVIAWLGSALQKGSTAVATLQRVEAAIREQLQKSPQGSAVREAEHAVQLARDEVEARQRKVSEVRSQVESLRPSRWLSDFLRERASSSDYHKYLGLTAIVRRDFEKLHELMTQAPISVDLDARDVVVENVGDTEKLDLAAFVPRLNKVLMGRDVPVDVERRTLAPDDGGIWRILEMGNARRIEVPRHGDGLRKCVVSYDGPRIDRIVLYIDDLDRCPPLRVVEVLEAVHLLLALPLFVVVVGVDVRWVTRSLELQYHDLWRRSEYAGGTNSDIKAATPRDYLEKIFQVPFWLPPLDPTRTGKMLAGLLEAGSPASEPVRAAANPIGQPTGIDGGAPIGAAPAAVRTPSDQGRLPAEQAGSGSAEEVGSRRQQPDTRDDGLDADTTAARLVLNRSEIDLITEQAPLVGRSPRAVKRFVNTYRLIRAAVPTADLAGFLGTPDVPGRNRIVIRLLGLAIGHPERAAELEREILTAPLELTIQEFATPHPSPSEGIAPSELSALAATPANTWTIAVLRRELARVNQYSFRSAMS
jgi:KAP family P-loop domain